MTHWLRKFLRVKAPGSSCRIGHQDEINLCRATSTRSRCWPKAIDESTDPLILLARSLESEYRRLRAANEEIAETERQAYALVTEGTNQVKGTGGYPDATFSLRLAFGVVSGYVEDGMSIQPTTDFEGGYAHAEAHAGQVDFDLPDSWMSRKSKINLNTQLISSALPISLVAIAATGGQSQRRASWPNF